jgi:hypothetical protein
VGCSSIINFVLNGAQLHSSFFFARIERNRAVKFRPQISVDLGEVPSNREKALSEFRPNRKKFARNFRGRSSTARISPFARKHNYYVMIYWVAVSQVVPTILILLNFNLQLPSYKYFPRKKLLNDLKKKFACSHLKLYPLE